MDQLGLSLDTVKSMVLRGPIVLFKDEAFLADQMAFFTTKFRYTEVGRRALSLLRSKLSKRSWMCPIC